MAESFVASGTEYSVHHRHHRRHRRYRRWHRGGCTYQPNRLEVNLKSKLIRGDPIQAM
ncbi:MAG: hypothetical protein QW404_03140 [Candidatus Nanoarchaeia archaeon]